MKKQKFILFKANKIQDKLKTIEMNYKVYMDFKSIFQS